MNCKKIAIMLSAYIDSELSGEDIEIVDKHLQICNQCRQEIERMKYITKKLSYEEEFKLNPYFETRLFNRIRENESQDFLAKDFITIEKKVIFTGLAFSLILSIFVFTASLPKKVNAYEEIRNYMFQNGTNSLSKSLAAKSEITADDIVSLVTG